jgi:glucose-1-phosphate thymidylyltransferase
MKCVLLCAGYATRLYPLTENQPKPLLSVGEKPIVEHIIDRVSKLEDIDEILIVTNSKFAPHFVSWLNDYKSEKQIKIIDDGTLNNKDRLGAVGDINFVLKHENIAGDLLVVAGDNLFEFSLNELISFFKQKQHSVLAFCDLKDKRKISKKYGAGILDEDGKLVDFEEKPEHPKSTLAATVVYVLTQKDVERIGEYLKSSERWDNPGDFMVWLSNKVPVYGFTFSEKWFDIGSFEALEEAYSAYEKGVTTNS